MKKVLLITNIPNAYRIPLFNEMHRQFHEINWQLTVVFSALGYSRRKSVINMDDCTFPYSVLGSEGKNTGDEEKTYFSYKGLSSFLKNQNPDHIIVSGFSPATVKVWWHCSRNNINYSIWSGSILKKGRNDQLLRQMMRKFLISRASSFIAYGTLASEYLQNYGAPPSRISLGINTVDTRFFSENTDRLRQQNLSDNKFHLLYTGYLVPRKNVGALLEVIHQLSSTRTDFCVDIVGDGNDRERLEQVVKQQKLENFVVFHGFKQRDKLPAFMAASTLFLFQTGFDIWGLTLNEAMAAGLPCLASKNAGACFDLIKSGENGFIVDYDKTEEVVQIINELLNAPEKARAIGKAARAYINEHASLKISSEGFIKALQLSEIKK